MAQPTVNINRSIFAVARIWIAQVNGVETSIMDALNQMRVDENADASVGHISLQLVRMQENGRYKTRYASFWPVENVNSEEVTRGTFNTIRQDIKYEERNPDRTYILFSLDNEALWDAMKSESLKERFPYYTLIDGVLLRKKVRKKVSIWGKAATKPKQKATNGISPKSCSGVIYDLVTGVGYNGNGLKHLNITIDIFSARDMLVSTPNNMIDLFREAERSERAKWPETKQHKSDVVKLLNSALLSAENLEYYDMLYNSVKDLIQQSNRFVAVTNYRKTLYATNPNVPQHSSSIPTMHNRPRILVPSGRYGPLFPIVHQVTNHPKGAMAFALCLVFFAGRYSNDMNGLLNAGVYALVLLGVALLSMQYLNGSDLRNLVVRAAPNQLQGGADSGETIEQLSRRGVSQRNH